MEVSDSLLNAAIQGTVVRVWKGLTWKGQFIGLLFALAFVFCLPLILYAKWVHPWLFGESFLVVIPHFAAVIAVLLLSFYLARWLANIAYFVLIPGGKIEARFEDLYRDACKQYYPDFDAEDAHKQLQALPDRERMLVFRRIVQYVVLDFLGSDVTTLQSILRARAEERLRLAQKTTPEIAGGETSIHRS